MFERNENDNAAAQQMAKGVFQALHGMYGNYATTRFNVGVLDSRGVDKGVVAARELWANALAVVPESIVQAALGKCMANHPIHPPTLPQFVALCKSLVPNRIERPFGGAAPRLGFTPAKREAEFSTIRGILKSAQARGIVPRQPGAGDDAEACPA